MVNRQLDISCIQMPLRNGPSLTEAHRKLIALLTQQAVEDFVAEQDTNDLDKEGDY